MANWIRWWNYASFWKFFGASIGSVVLCLLCGLDDLLIEMESDNETNKEEAE